MRNLKSRLFALLLTLTFAASVGASTPTSVIPLGPIAGSAGFSNSLTGPIFDDFIHFDAGPNAGALWGASATNSYPLVGLSSFVSKLYAGTWDMGSIGGAGAPIAFGTPGFFPISGGFSIIATAGLTGPLALGAYTLHLSGTVAPLGGSYGGSITLAPVPEPGEWALMLSGIGLIGFMIRRRSVNRA